MPRVQDIKNQWGVQGGPNPQRSDLWQVDLEPAINGLNRVDAFKPQLLVLPRYVPSAIAFPELKVRPEPFRRDARSYNMPGQDEPVEAVRINFIMDDGGSITRSTNDVSQSEVYRVLDVWRRVVRAGRGALGSEPFVILDENYSIQFRFPIYAYLCRGYSQPPISSAISTQSRFFRPNTATQNATFDVPTALAPDAVQTRILLEREAAFNRQQTVGLEVSSIVMLENCWLSAFRITDLNYDQARIVTIEASIYPENIYQFQRGGQPPITL